MMASAFFRKSRIYHGLFRKLTIRNALGSFRVEYYLSDATRPGQLKTELPERMRLIRCCKPQLHSKVRCPRFLAQVADER
jgi:hypothetical protein